MPEQLPRSSEQVRVFIDYIHDSAIDASRVRELAEKLRADGVDCWIDQYFKEPGKQWSEWLTGQIQDADWVLMVFTDRYLHDRRSPDEGSDVLMGWEHNPKFIPIVFSTEDARLVPQNLSNKIWCDVSTKEGYAKLLRAIYSAPHRALPPWMRSHGDTPAEDFAEESTVTRRERGYRFASPPDPIGPGEVPFSRISQYEFSYSTKVVIDAAANRAGTATRSMRLSSALLFIELVDHGRSGRSAEWAGDFIRQQVEGHTARFEDDRDAYFRRKGIPISNEGSSGQQRTPNYMSSGAAFVIARAQELAVQTTGERIIKGRHLLAALLESRPDGKEYGAQHRMAVLAVHPAVLRERLYEWVRGYGDDDNVWRENLLGRETPPLLLASFDADHPGSPQTATSDYLDVKRDTLAFATLIAAQAVSPPLSIGLFGDWGSGKTFFMRRLRYEVAELARKARSSGEMQKDQDFFKHIVQIEFNAWHYVEGNLWASMVEHIFNNLRITGDDQPSVVREMQEHWIRQLEFEVEARKDATERIQFAEDRVVEASQKLESARVDHARKAEELGALSSENLTRGFRLSKAAPDVAKILETLGLRPVGDGAVELQGSLREARAVLERGIVALTPLLRASDRRRRWAWLLIILAGAPALALIGSLVLTRMGREGISEVASSVTAVAAFLLGIADWLRRQAKWVSESLIQVEEAQKKYDEELAAKQAESAKKITVLEQELALGRQAYAAAQQELNDATRREKEAQKELAEATAGRLLARFVQDRAASSDYRQHLGILALVRNDFERLSKLIEAENERLSSLRTLEEETQGNATRINRIVLYIDDLDRCPPAKVVEVLQAVHLLLAFPLFVVVLGVDARWVARSLETRYRELLRADGSIPSSGLHQMLGVARTEDYLEKIFQIPFWVQPMNVQSSRQMIRGLLGTTSTPLRGGDAPSGVQIPNEPSASSAVPKGGADPFLPAGLGSSDSTDPNPLVQDASAHRQMPIPGTEVLAIREFELAFMDELAPLLGRSPRALKRFVNTYRLVKASLSPAEQVAFLRRDDGVMSDFQIVLFLLAVDTGLPDVSLQLFNGISRGRLFPSERPGSGELDVGEPEAELPDAEQPYTLERIVADVGRYASLLKTRQWLLLHTWLQEHCRGVPGRRLPAESSRWVARVSRFSFRSAPEANAST
jgi:hypothetical protein